MRTTIEIPETVLEPVKSKEKRVRRVLPDDNERLRQAWLDSAVTYSPDDSGWTIEERKRRAKEWIARLKKLAEEINRDRVGSQTLHEIIEEDRNRLEKIP